MKWCLLWIWFASVAGIINAAESQRPNVVFLLVDDWRFDALGPAGNKLVKTPNIDKIATRGTYFKNTFVTTSICSVSRASIFTGQWGRRHQIWDFATGFNMDQWSQTYPAKLKEVGYNTGFVGKLGVGSPQAVKAMEKDFDFWEGMAGQGGKHFIDPADPSQKHLTAKYGDAALKFLSEVDTKRPFALQVSFSAVHARDKAPREFQPDLRDESLYQDVEIPLPDLATEEDFSRLPEFVKTSEGRTRFHWRYDEPKKAQGILKDYYRLVTGVDREVGRIYELLEARGVLENTVIVLMGDNGFALGDRGLADKWFMYEESIRVPLVILDPRVPKAQQGKVVEAMTLNVDIAPTFLDFAGIEKVQGMQGRSVAPLMRGETPADWRKEYFYEHLTFPHIIPPSEGIRTEDHKYIRWIDREPIVEQLFHLKSDPLERKDLASDPAHSKLLNAMREKWAKAREGLK